MNPEDEIRGKLQAMGRAIKGQLPKGYAFVLLIPSLGEGGTTLYVADVGRADAIQLMREFIAVQMEERNWTREMPELEIDEDFEAWWTKQMTRSPQDLKKHCRDAYLAGRMSA